MSSSGTAAVPRPSACLSSPGVLRRGTAALAAALLLLARGTGAAPAPETDSRPTLRASVVQGELRLEWSPVTAGGTVTLETTPNLVSPAWQPAPSPGGWPSPTTSWSTPLPPDGAGFFRLVLHPPAPARGTVLTNVLLKTLTSAEMAALLQQYLLPPGTPLGVEARRVVYTTIDPRGQPTIASMLAALPVNPPKAMPIAAYLHGTLTRREDAPSRLVGEADIGLILASGGYLTVLPDYLGMGDSPGFHPYHHAKTHATASVDALRALRALAADRAPGWNGQLFLTGYSQGGHAAMATQRELESLHADEFTLTASAPCAGAHDLSGTAVEDLLSGRTPPNPYYSAYLIFAYQEIYGLAPSISDLLRPPYDRTLPPLFDGTHGSDALNAALPARPSDILRPEVLEAFRADPNHPIRQALRSNDTHTGWIPRTPTRLYHCQGDQDVLPVHSRVAHNTFTAAGATRIELLDPLPFANHTSCAPMALLATKIWFDSLKQ